MPRRGGNTPRSERRKHQGHRAHKRTRAMRIAARLARRPRSVWDPEAWAERHLEPGPHVVAAVEMGRKTHPQSKKPQQPKEQGRGGRGGKGGGSKK